MSRSGHGVTVIDFFNHDKAREQSAQQYAEGKQFLLDNGVKLIDSDLVTLDLSVFDEVNRVTCFHVLEHFHHSPIPLFKSIKSTLKPNGACLIGVPNSVNLLKRVKVLFGYTNYPSYGDYALSNHFTGHVREYSMSDLRQMASLVGFNEAEIFGRNYFGSLYERFGENRVTKVAGRALRFFPGLSGSLFLRYTRD